MTWAGLFDLPLLCERFVRGEHMSIPELDYVYICIANNFSTKPATIPPNLNKNLA